MKISRAIRSIPVANIPRGILSTRVTLVTCRMRVDGQIRFEYEYVWTWKFLNSERSRCVWAGS